MGLGRAVPRLRPEGGLRAVVLVSGRGSNLAALARAARDEQFGVRIEGVVADRDCPARRVAQSFGIPFTVAGLAELPEVVEGADLLLLAGYRRILPEEFVRARLGWILNVHPSLLPAFPGLDAIRRAHAAGVRETGVTVHVVTPRLDAGPILAQERIPILPGEPLASLERRVHALEHRLYPEAVARYAARLCPSRRFSS